MPRIVKRSKLNREPGHCETCGKFCEKPYVYQVVPSYISILEVSGYSKTAPKIKRKDFKGYRKVITSNFCDVKCREERTFIK